MEDFATFALNKLIENGKKKEEETPATEETVVEKVKKKVSKVKKLLTE